MSRGLESTRRHSSRRSEVLVVSKPVVSEVSEHPHLYRHVIRSYDGTEIACAVAGDGPVTLMFFHGWGGNRSVWESVVANLDGEQFRCVCMDWRGHGDSGRPVDGYDWEGFRRDALAVAERERASRFIPVGFSMGAKLACYLAAKCPERIPAQVLVALPALGTVPIERDAGLQVCRDASEWQRVKPFFRNLWFGPLASEDLLEACCKTVAQVPRPVLEATAEMLLWTSLEAAVGRLNLPSLVVSGSEDPVWHPAYQEEHALRYFSNPTTAVAASGHFVPLERPVELARWISAFAAEQARGFTSINIR